MIVIDAFLRFSGVGIMLFTLALVFRDLKYSASSLYLLLAIICTCSHFLGFTPELFQPPYFLRMLLRVLDVFQLVFIWLFTLSLFQKDFKLTIFHLLFSIIYSSFILMERLVQFKFIHNLPFWWPSVIIAMSIMLVAHTVFVTILGRNDDLIEARRRSRVYVVIMNAFSTLVAVVVGLILMINGLNKYQPTLNVISIWPTIVWVAYWVTNIDKHIFAFDQIKSTSSKKMNSRDLNLRTKLKTEVVDKHCYLENKLSIKSLAMNLGVSTYRLRAFINQTLGYSNFSSYINSFRIDAIKLALSKPENEHIPILTIAMNHGFNSLPPFNRAFKKREGMTPSEFRQNLSY